MKIADAYFQKNDFTPQLLDNPHEKLGICVVIPSFNEPYLIESLNSIANCQLPVCSVEVLVVVNYPQNSQQEVVSNANYCIKIVKSMLGNQKLRFHPIMAFNLPPKHAGVGLARKIGMDEAAFRFSKIKKYNGIIACFDADATCAPNYLVELEKLWIEFPNTAACSVHYEHPLKGSKFSHNIYEGIAKYELHLRYYIEACRYTNHPHAYHTIGSSMACSTAAYIRVGGMNRRKAGEDFYFLQKIIPHGEFRELNSTCIYPSPRPSDRVPFGTGHAITKMLEHNLLPYSTYCMEAWEGVRKFTKFTHKLFDNAADITLFLSETEPSLVKYLIDNQIESKLEEIRSNTSTFETFEKRFFLWFDAFKLLKYLNFAHTNHFQRKPVEEEAFKLAQLIGLNVNSKCNCFDLLKQYRSHQSENYWKPLQ